MIIDNKVILCGMPSENAILKAAFPNNVVLTGADKLNLESLVPASATGIISMGLCGGLAAPLVVPQVGLGSSITDGNGSNLLCDPEFNAAVMRAGSASNDPWARGMRLVPWFSSGAMDLANSVGQRAALAKSSGTEAIDDESFYAARLCQARGLTFNVARPLSDDYSDTLPLAATGAIMNKDGSANEDYLFRAIATEPVYQTVDLFQVAWDYNASLAALQQLAAALCVI